VLDGVGRALFLQEDVGHARVGRPHATATICDKVIRVCQTAPAFLQAPGETHVGRGPGLAAALGECLSVLGSAPRRGTPPSGEDAGVALSAAKSGEIPALSRNGDAPGGTSPVAYLGADESSPRMKGGSCATGAGAPSSS